MKICGRWSDICEVKLPEKVLKSIEFEKISMRVLEFSVNFVDCKM